MMPSRRVVFLINLLQDVNVARPLVFMAARDLGLPTELLVSRAFVKRDKSGVWQQELEEIGQATGAPVIIFDNEVEALQLLQGASGVLVAASESNLSAHAPTHDVFRFAPGSFLKITLQHGFECVGFLHNRAHDVAHGDRVTFAADVVCGWCDGSRLTSMAPSQRSKLYVSGPPLVLQTRHPPLEEGRAETGLVCENLHSVRLNIGGDFKTEFMEVFGDFCTALAGEGRTVTLRPHPSGKYVLKNKLELPQNVTLNNNPIYKVDLTQFAYGISAPSSVLLDLVLAGIPAAVWRDGSGVMDCGNYDGLTEISSLQDWLDFSREAAAHPDRFIERQRRFLEAQKMPTDPAEVHRRFAALFDAGARASAPVEIAQKEAERILFVANAYLPTLQICFVKPLAPLVEAGEIATDFLTEEQMKKEFGDRLRDDVVCRWLDKRLALFKPTMLVFCRYSGPHAEHLANRAKRAGIPVIFHIDDDLLNIPVTLGQRKFEYHNDPHRLKTIGYLLDETDVVYCSTEALKGRLESLGSKAPRIAGKLNCSGIVLVPAINRPVRKVGYMASADHAHNLDMVLPAIVEFMRRNPEIEFGLFGSIPKPAALEEFRDRIRMAPPVTNYEDFLNEFAKSGWDIGICPLAPTEFNRYKGNNKWIEYTAVGAAVVATGGTIYDECCADGCGILAETPEEWLAALQKLTQNPGERFAQVRRAHKKLIAEYSTERLCEQVLDVFEQAKSLHEQAGLRETPRSCRNNQENKAMKPLIPPTVFSQNPYKPEWFERDYLFTPEGAMEAPKHHCKTTFEISFPFIRRRRNAVDVGCRLGEYTRYLQRHFRMTYCFDPNLWTNFASNVDLTRVTHFNCALGDETGKIQMHGGTHRHVEGKMREFRVFRLDDFELEDIDYIKIDVEGFERKVLSGACRTIEKYRPLVVIEQNEVRLPEEEPFAAKLWLEERGYKHVASCPRGWDYVMMPE